MLYVLRNNMTMYRYNNIAYFSYLRSTTYNLPFVPLSYSQIQLYRTCPKQYEYAVVQKLFRPISASESFGSSIHNTLKRWGELELKHEELESVTVKHQLNLFTEEAQHPHPELTKTTLQELWRLCFIADGYDNQQKMNEKFQLGVKVLNHFFHWWSAKNRRVVSIEQSFSIILNNAQKTKISGRFDRIEEGERGLHIIDYKTGKPKSDDDLHQDLQLSLYAIAAETIWNQPIESLTLLFFTEDAIIPQVTTRSEAQLQEARTMIESVALGIDAKAFTATPSQQKCRYCPFRDRCSFRIE